MSGLIIFLLVVSYLIRGVLMRVSLMHTSLGIRPGICSAVATILLWPVVSAAECAEWMREW